VCPQTHDPTSLTEKKKKKRERERVKERKREIEWKLKDWRGSDKNRRERAWSKRA
jgi:hypothetical protein